MYMYSKVLDNKQRYFNTKVIGPVLPFTHTYTVYYC